MRTIVTVSAVVVMFFACLTGAASAARIAGLAAEVPTIECLGVRCFVTDDTGKREAFKLEYREAAGGEWKRGLDLFRVETSYLKGVTVPDGQQLYAGSVFDLKEGAEYELRVTAPDGTSQTVRSKTRLEPVSAKPLRTLYVAPGAGGGRGTKADPFKGIAAADAVAKAGDLILLGAGVYEGGVTFTKSGTESHPIVWRSADGRTAVLDAGGASRCVTAGGLRHVIYENLVIRNAEWGFVAHGASDLTLRRCLFTKVQSGFTSTRMPSSGHVIVDCTFEGPSTWPRTKGIEDTEAIQVIGDGHVVAYNRIGGFGDAISTFRSPSNACDFYNNEISECTDDGIEMDYSGVNTRCYRNRLTNCFQGLSVQPLQGGPCYIFRNVQYNVGMEILKMHNRPSGFLYLHNTTVKSGMPLVLYTNSEVRNSIFRNNLFIGTQANYALESTAKMIDCDWDYDGFTATGKTFAKWNGVRYPTFDELRAKGPIEKHGVIVDAKTLFASGIQTPADLKTQFKPDVNDLRLKEGCAAVDAGEVLPGINDGFKGNAPDLGAYELGQPLPAYGPRPAQR